MKCSLTTEIDSVDYTNPSLWQIENVFIHLCAFLARRAVNSCFPCLACHNNLPWQEDSRHTCFIDETHSLQEKLMNEIITLSDTDNFVREKFFHIMNAKYTEYVCYQDKLFNI